MILKTIAAVTGIWALLFAAGSFAQEAPGRFAMKDVEDGLIRMDTQTGAVSHCRRKATDWVCETVADERKAYQDEITRLTRENEELRQKLARDAEARKKRFPGDEELDQVMTFMEKIMRRVFEFARSMRNQIAEET